MDDQATKGLISFFQEIPDHRAMNRQFRMIDLFAIAFMAVICDAQDWPDEKGPVFSHPSPSCC